MAKKGYVNHAERQEGLWKAHIGRRDFHGQILLARGITAIIVKLGDLGGFGSHWLTWLERGPPKVCRLLKPLNGLYSD